MEITKTIELTNSLGEKIKNAYKKDIEKVINKLIEEYDIYKRGSDTLLTKNELNKIFLDILNQEVKYCSAATKSGTKCKNKPLDNSKFCAKHFYSTENLREFLHRTSISNEKRLDKQENFDKNEDEYNKNQNLYIINKDKKEKNDKNINITNLKNILIENAFYYVDTKWIYDKTSMEKVGYIDKNEREEINYILTSDPFILEFCNE